MKNLKARILKFYFNNKVHIWTICVLCILAYFSIFNHAKTAVQTINNIEIQNRVQDSIIFREKINALEQQLIIDSLAFQIKFSLDQADKNKAQLAQLNKKEKIINISYNEAINISNNASMVDNVKFFESKFYEITNK